MMKKVIILTLAMCSCVLIALGQNSKIAKGLATVVVEQSSVKADSMGVMDPANGKNFYFIKPNAEGNFVATFGPLFSGECRIWVDGTVKWGTNLSLENGDNVNIKTDYAANAKFSGRGAVKQEIIYFDSYSFSEFIRNTDFKNLSANDLSRKVKDLSKTCADFLEANKQKISPTYYKEKSAYFYYTGMRNIMGVPDMLKDFAGRKISASIPDGYWKLGNDVKMNDQLIWSQAYMDFMRYFYLGFLKSVVLHNQGKLDNDLSNEESMKLEFDLVEKYYTGKTRSRVLAGKVMSCFPGSKNLEEFKPRIEKYESSQYILPEDVKEVLDSYDRYAKLAAGKTPPPFTLKDLEGNTITLDKYAGKIIYIDFWASWCGPCRREMKEGSPKLHEKFKDNKDVVFLYISIDDNTDLWKKAIVEDKIEGIHVLSPGGFDSEVGKAFNVTSVPRYVIIGKDGKIFDNQAPRPSEGTTESRINEAFNK